MKETNNITKYKINKELVRNSKNKQEKVKKKPSIIPYRKHKHLKIDGSIKAKAFKNSFAVRNRLNIQVNSKRLDSQVEDHSLDVIMKPIYKFYQATLFYMGKERQYNDTIYDGNFYHRFKYMFLNKLHNYKYRYALPRSLKKKMFDTPRSNFGLDLHEKAKAISNAVSYISRHLKPTSLSLYIRHGHSTFYVYAPKNLRKKNRQVIRQLNHGSATKYKNLNKWGIKGAEYYNKARRKSAMKTIRYNFIYYNMSVFRYICYKNYVNKLISLLIRKYKDPLVNNKIKLRILFCIKNTILFLPSILKKIPTLLSIFKMKLSNKLSYKQENRQIDSKFKYVLRRWYITNIRDTYFSFIKSMLLRYFKLHLILSFGKSNIFIVFANHSGSVIDYRSIGMLGYKKEKKKTQYASEDLIRETFPDFFDYFKLRFGVLLEIIGYFTSDLFKFYFNTILDPILENPKLDMVIEKNNRTYKNVISEALSYWNYNTKGDLHHIKLGFAKVMLYTWEKYSTLKVVLKGAKQKIKKLMRNILKRLRVYQYENEVFLSKILFIARNIKPHNGCRSPKKGRKKTKRRKQRLKYKHKYKMKQYDFKQRYLSHEFNWRRNLTKTYDLPYPDYLQRDSTLRVLSRGMQHKRNITKFANFGTNLLNPAYKLSLYPKPNNTKPRLSLFHLGKPQDLGKHFTRQLPDLYKETSKLNKNIKFYRRTTK